jgi:hypothetical protein
VEKTCKALSQNQLLKIGQLAEKTDVAVATIRYYESLGLLELAQRSERPLSAYNLSRKLNPYSFPFQKFSKCWEFAVKEVLLARLCETYSLRKLLILRSRFIG